MTPLIFLLWSLTVAVAVVIVGSAVAIVVGEIHNIVAPRYYVTRVTEEGKIDADNDAA